MTTKKNEPRGYRNNNPGNIRRSSDSWAGLCSEQNDKDFFQFRTMEYGYRALIKTLRNYKILHGCKSLKEMIYRWAPTNENNSAAYLRDVCSHLQVTDSYLVDIDDKDTMVTLAAAISRHENGIEPDMEVIQRGYDMINHL